MGGLIVPDDFDRNFSAILSAAAQQRGLQPGSELIKAMRASVPLSDDNAARIAGVLHEIEAPCGAGILAVWLGARVESGGDPALTCRPILEAFLTWSRKIESSPEEGGEAAEDPDPDQDVAEGLQLLGQALVAHLSRSPEELSRIAQSPQIKSEIERVEYASAGAMWLMHLLRQQSGELVVLGVAERRGAVVRYENISNCFHLFTLLQSALAPLFPGGESPSEELLAVARGESQADVSDRARWHYGQPTSPSAELGAWIWGEGAPDQIASIEGSRVLLLWPPILESRSWDGGFFGPVLYAKPPRVEVVEPLADAEIDRWWERLGLPKA